MADARQIQIDNPQFLKKTPQAFDCFILLGKHYITYMMMNQSHDIVYTVRHKSYQNQVIAKHDFDEILADRLVKKASKIFLAIDAQKNTIVPTEFYIPKDRELYIEHLFEIAPEEELHEMNILDEMKSLFCLKKDSVQFLKSRLRNVTFLESSACLLSVYPAHIHSQDVYSIFISVKEDIATLSIYKGIALQLHNVHTYQAKEDIVFFVANYIDKLSIDQLTCGINLHGECDTTVQLHDIFASHFARVRYCSRLKELGYPEELFEYSPQYFFNLFSIAVCVS
jgi:hypothetical protein